MIKSCFLVATAAAALVLPTAASAYLHHHHHAAHHYHMVHHGMAGYEIHANGYCNGVADGTGLRHHCGTATGGVPGGLPNRN